MRLARILLAVLVVFGTLVGVTGVSGAVGPPRANPDQYYGLAGQTLDVPAPGVLANDTDPDGDPLTAVYQYGGTTSGDLEFRSDGSFTYTPRTSRPVFEYIGYLAFDGTSYSYTGSVTIALGVRPTARDDRYGLVSRPGSRVLRVSAPGVLENDTSSIGEQLTPVLDRAPRGTLTLRSNGSFTYRPPRGFFGIDTFRYHVVDPIGASRRATVTIRVVRGNGPPVAVDDSYDTDEDVTLRVAAPGALANDHDPDGDALRAEFIDVDFGEVEFRADGSFDYFPPSDFDSDARIRYRVFDDIVWSEPATILVRVRPVNDPPMGEPDEYETWQDQPLSVGAPGFLGNDTDVEGDGLSALCPFDPPDHGTVDCTSGDGGFVYAPEPGYSGTDNFAYVPFDGQDYGYPTYVSITIYES
jgi:hypothetical protein